MAIAIKKVKISLAPWQSALLTIGILMLVGIFTINSIKNKPAEPIVIDEQNLSTLEVQALQTVLSPLGQVQFFSADLSHIREEVAKLSWVENVEVSRDWYRGVKVSVIPRKAVANFGSKQMVDANGKVFTPVDSTALRNPNLITLYGDEADARSIMVQTYRINNSFMPLGMHVTDLSVTARQTWMIRFNNDLRVIVDREQTEQKLYELPKTLVQHYKDKINQIQSVDLRYKNGFVIAWKSPSPSVNSQQTPKTK